MADSLAVAEVHEGSATARLASPDLDPRTLANWWSDFRAGFHDGADNEPEQSRSYAYLDGHDAGYDFRAWISAARPYTGEPHFPGWPWPEPNKIPRGLACWMRGREMTGIKIARYGHGGDRKSDQFKASVSPGIGHHLPAPNV